MKCISVTQDVAQPVYQTKQEIEEVTSPAEDLITNGVGFVGLEGIPLEVILQKGCYDTDCTGGCG
jgi:hypothetical protein